MKQNRISPAVLMEVERGTFGYLQAFTVIETFKCPNVHSKKNASTSEAAMSAAASKPIATGDLDYLFVDSDSPCYCVRKTLCFG